MTEEPEKLAEGTLISHLLELRDRLIKALLGVGLCFVPCMMYSNDIFSYVSQPLQEKLPACTHLIATGVMSPFTTPFKLSFFIAAFISMPWILYQLWAFVAPGLYRHEKRFAMPLLVSSVVLFYAGIAFAYFAILPVALKFFVAVAPAGVAVMTDIGHYLDFVLALFIGFGLAFETPVAIVLLVWTGFVTPATLAKRRDYVLVGVFVVAAVLTPPDVFSQILLAVPLYGLFELGILAARWLVPAARQVESQAAK